MHRLRLMGPPEAAVPSALRARALIIALLLVCAIGLDPARYFTMHSCIGGIAWAGGDGLFTETPEEAASELEDAFKNAETSLANGDIRTARRRISLLQYKLWKHGKVFSGEERKSRKKRLGAISQSVQRTVDSLVKMNLKIVKTGGPKAGYDFRQYLATEKGVTETELAPVDLAIAERGIPAGEEEESFIAPQTAAPARRPVPPVAPAAMRSEVSPDRSDADAGRYGASARAQAAKVRALLDANKIEEAKTVFRIYSVQIRRYMDRGEFERLKAAVDAVSAKEQERQAFAAQKVSKIERLLAQNRSAEAFTELRAFRESMMPYLHGKDFNELEKNVGRAYTGFIRTQAAANAAMLAIRELLSEKKDEKAYYTFETHLAELETGLSKTAFEELRGEVVSSYDAMRNKKKRAASLDRRISALIRAGNVLDAGRLFTGNEALLREFLEEKRFSALASDVDRAQKDYFARKKKAVFLVRTIDSLLDRSDIGKAYAFFENTKRRLRSDLADDTRYFELRDRCAGAHAGLLRKQRAAERTAQEIEYLIRLREGRKAYELFNQEAPSLRDYGKRGVFMRLENAVTLANTGYVLQCDNGRKTAAGIETLLNRDSVDRAYADYRAAEDDLEFYLGGDTAIEALGKRVTQAYRTLLYRKQQAASTERRIRGLIGARRGDEALARFNETRRELANYLDAKTFSSLARDTDRANKEYRAAAEAARLNASRVRGLLASGRIEEAHTAFNANEAALRLYLEGAEFQSLSARVDSSSGALQEKKREALRIINTADNLISRKRGDSAYAIIRRNEAFLAGCLHPATCKGAIDRAEAAESDYEKNRTSARSIEKKLLGLIHRDNFPEAGETFNDRRDFLEVYLDGARFTKLKAAVSAANDYFMDERKKARAVASSLAWMIRRRRAVEAKAEFDARERKLARFLPPGEYRELAARVEKEYANTLLGRREAEETVDAIRQLFERNETAFAYLTFKEMRPVLEQYMPNAKFTAIESEVTCAWSEREKKIGRAREYAKNLKLLARSKPAEAYKEYRRHRHELANYLDAQSLADLESAVTEGYKKAGSKSGTEG